MLKYSTRLKAENKRLFISPQSRAIADLLIMGWTPTDAYIAVGLNNESFSDEYNKGQIDQITEDRKFLDYMQKKEKALRRGYKKTVPSSIEANPEEDNNNNRFRTKDEVINALVSTVSDLKGKDKADVLMKIADLQQMKKDDTTEEDDTVHFYVPLTCSYCDLYNREKEKRKDKRKANSEG